MLHLLEQVPHLFLYTFESNCRERDINSDLK